MTLIEPGGFATDWAGDSARRSKPIAAYGPVREAAAQARAGRPIGDPVASAQALLRVVDADDPPLRCFFGVVPIKVIEADYAARLQTWRAWQQTAELAQG